MFEWVRVSRPYKDGILDDTIYIDGTDSDYIISNIDGLGPPSNWLTASQSAVLSGGWVSGSRLAMRNIVIDFEFNPYALSTRSVSEMRDLLYRYYAPGTELTLTFGSGETEIATTEGWVETYEVVIFAEVPTVQVSIICPDPVLYGEEHTYTGNNGIAQAFAYQGSTPVGVNITLTATAEIPFGPNYYLRSDTSPTSPSLRLDTSRSPLPSTWLIGRAIYLHTQPGRLGAFFRQSSIPTGNRVSILNVVHPSSTWPILDLGVYQFSLRSVDGAALSVDVEVSFQEGLLGL